LIQIYTGDGKGKSTAAMGLAIRSAGHGFKVRIIQFLKGSTYSGELFSLQKLGIEIYQFGRTCPHAAVIRSGFMDCQECDQCWIRMTEVTELDRRKVEMAWQLAQDTIGQGFKLLILDEILNAVNKGLVPEDELADWLQRLPEDIEVVLTGRNAPAVLLKHADLVTEMKKIKHPFDNGVKSRRGIEY
jgi:cob(I)alamin adenosyltransferase